jgi:ABC-type transport system involved in multi-copper enzyme maturation permease subunit
MRPVWLIATNFAREQRLTLLVLLGWLLVFALMYSFWDPKEHDDLVFFFRQFAAYAIILNVLVSAQGFYKDRRTRRMIAVLSKGITRAQYLVGHTLGCALFSGVYLLAFAAAQFWFSVHFGIEIRVAETLLAVWIASVLAAVVSLLFASFLPPLLVSIVTLLLLVAPAAVVSALPEQWSVLLPVAHVSRHLLHYQYGVGWTGGWAYATVALIQIVVCWLIAAAIFSRRDVTAAVE